MRGRQAMDFHSPFRLLDIQLSLTSFHYSLGTIHWGLFTGATSRTIGVEFLSQGNPYQSQGSLGFLFAISTIGFGLGLSISTVRSCIRARDAAVLSKMCVSWLLGGKTMTGLLKKHYHPRAVIGFSSSHAPQATYSSRFLFSY
ncbi:hypothetical protein B0H63DRAFT_122922 [Podospora didyma]|uniref:Uncharacterized protein n=1 Tax=Podospora didyma TaxID=330526 RepID=A0AAE0NZV6_9PEZI|nr:hypothetical protein B0H63DRAFT_122922 [Podospora didyma]